MSEHIPKRSDWQNLKRDTGCPDEPAKGIKMGDAIDKFQGRETAIAKLKFTERVPASVELYAEMEQFFVNFLKKVEKGKIKDYPKFEKTILDKYIDVVRAKKEDGKRYAPTVEILKSDSAKYFAMLMKLEAGKTTGKELGVFRSGPLRGLMATLSKIEDVPNARKMYDLLAPFDDLINTKVKADTPVDLVGRVVKALLAASEKIEPLARADGLL